MSSQDIALHVHIASESSGRRSVWCFSNNKGHVTSIHIEPTPVATYDSLNQIKVFTACLLSDSDAAIPLDLNIPLRNNVWHCHPFAKASLNADCFQLRFHDGGVSYQILSEQGRSSLT